LTIHTCRTACPLGNPLVTFLFKQEIDKDMCFRKEGHRRFPKNWWLGECHIFSVPRTYNDVGMNIKIYTFIYVIYSEFLSFEYGADRKTELVSEKILILLSQNKSWTILLMITLTMP
jgi:hypothetical protein